MKPEKLQIESELSISAWLFISVSLVFIPRLAFSEELHSQSDVELSYCLLTQDSPEPNDLRTFGIDWTFLQNSNSAPNTINQLSHNHSHEHELLDAPSQLSLSISKLLLTATFGVQKTQYPGSRSLAAFSDSASLYQTQESYNISVSEQAERLNLMTTVSYTFQARSIDITLSKPIWGHLVLILDTFYPIQIVPQSNLKTIGVNSLKCVYKYTF